MANALDVAFLQGMDAVLNIIGRPIREPNGDYLSYRVKVEHALSEAQERRKIAASRAVWRPMSERPHGRRIVYRFENGMMASSPFLMVPVIAETAVACHNKDIEIMDAQHRELHAIAWCDRWSDADLMDS